MNSTIRTTAELEINRTIIDAFIEDQRNQLAGLYEAGDKRYTEAIIADAERNFPERWKADTKRELIAFLACRAELYIEAENEKRNRPPRGGWHNPASAENGKKGGRPKKDE